MSTIEVERSYNPEIDPPLPPEDWRAELGLTEEVIGGVVEQMNQLPASEAMSIAASRRFSEVTEEEYKAFTAWASGDTAKREERNSGNKLSAEDIQRFREIDDLGIKQSQHRRELAALEAVGKEVVGRLVHSMVPGRYQMGRGIYDYFTDSRNNGYLARVEFVVDPQAPGRIKERKVVLEKDWVPPAYQDEVRYASGRDYVRFLKDIIYNEG